MAKALDFTPRVKTPEEKLGESVHDSAPALDESLKLLRELHEHGVLDVLIKIVRGGEGLSAAAIHILGGQSGTAVLRNGVEIVKMLEGLDHRELRSLGHALQLGVSEGAQSVAQGKGVGLGDLVGLMRDRDVQLALGALFGLLKGVGRGLRESRGEETETGNQSEVDRGAR
jgi:uncharacterized protein YjgD (DUF1641 family)